MQKIFLSIILTFIFLNTNAQHGKLYFVTKDVNRVAVNSNYTYHFIAKDSSGKPIKYIVQNLPAWLQFDDATKTIKGFATTVGQYPVKINAYTENDTAHQPFMLTVYDKQTTNILCLGNSITNGVDTFNSYRRDLWQLLHAENYNFDFIGSWNKHHMGSDAPVPDFDMDNEGHSGWNFHDVLQPPSWDKQRGNLYSWMHTYTPDIVLIELGTNDVFQCRKTGEMLTDLSTILKVLRTKNPSIKVFIAQIPPLGAQWEDKKLCGFKTTYDDAINELNKQLPIYAKQHTTANSPIIIVDQYTGFNASTDTFDDIHPNTKGEKIMAQKWFDAIKNYLHKL